MGQAGLKKGNGLSSEPPGQHYDRSLLGYLSVPYEDAKDIVHKGYIASMEWDRRVPPPGHDYCHTSRKEVPYSKTRIEAVERMLAFKDKCKYAQLLEIHKTPDPREYHEDSDRIDDHQLTWSGIRLKEADKQVLHKKFIYDGGFFSRGHCGVPCPFCREQPFINPDPAVPDESLRRRVGVAVFACPAASPGLDELNIPFFLASPCSRERCLVEMQQRQMRLSQGNKRTVYHACGRATANEIQKCGGKFLRGSEGEGGGGIYFAHTPRECWWKAEDDGGYGKGMGAVRRWWAARDEHGWDQNGYAFLECEVMMGRELEASDAVHDMTFKDLQHKEGGPYDSVVLDRGHTGYPVPSPPVVKETVDGGWHPRGTLLSTRIEDVNEGRAESTHPGYEFVVYSWDQVLIIRELPHEEIDPPPGW